MSISVVVVLVVVAVAVVTIVAVITSRRSNDGVDSFRRQIDALSPEARRPVVDQVQNAAGRHPADTPETSADRDLDDEDGVRGA